jgi:hypothetical protein
MNTKINLAVKLFSEVEEKHTPCGGWGFRIGIMDFLVLIKYYLDIQGKLVPLFNDNLPGKYLVLSALQYLQYCYQEN